MNRNVATARLVRFASLPALLLPLLTVALSLGTSITSQVSAATMLGGEPLVAAPDAAGCWSGYWQSCTSGHQGTLKATIVPCGEGKYRAEFRGRFFKVFPFRYSVTLHTVAVESDALHLAGSQNLGRLFGTFHFTAVVTECRFEAQYSSCKDRGRFVMNR